MLVLLVECLGGSFSIFTLLRFGTQAAAPPYFSSSTRPPTCVIHQVSTYSKEQVKPITYPIMKQNADFQDGTSQA